VPATGSPPRPGDFPLGSVKSRAAARALALARQPQLTQWDLDCLLIERISRYLHASAWPSYSEMEKLPVWQRGWELVKSSPHFPKFLETVRQLGAGKLGKCPFASSEFARAHGREAAAGDILIWTDLKPSTKAEHINEWRAIWVRRVPEYPFPFRHETGFLFVRLAEYAVREPGRRTLGGFAPVWDEVPQHRWAWIEDEALGSNSSWCDVERRWAGGMDIAGLMPKIQAVLFCEDGTVKPLKTGDQESAAAPGSELET
jgi:hypothetical protein